MLKKYTMHAKEIEKNNNSIASNSTITFLDEMLAIVIILIAISDVMIKFQNIIDNLISN